jgi:hypothetical protein
LKRDASLIATLPHRYPLEDCFLIPDHVTSRRPPIGTLLWLVVHEFQLGGGGKELGHVLLAAPWSLEDQIDSLAGDVQVAALFEGLQVMVAPCLRAMATSEIMTEKNKTPKIAVRYLMMTLLCGPAISPLALCQYSMD